MSAFGLLGPRPLRGMPPQDRASHLGDLVAVTVAEASAAIAAAAGRLSRCAAAALARATGTVGRLDNLMAAAMSNGELQNFNREFRRRRMEAAARRLPFPSYNHALAKLRAALAGSIAGTTSDIMRAVFEDR
jgi:hypothetical protein